MNHLAIPLLSAFLLFTAPTGEAKHGVRYLLVLDKTGDKLTFIDPTTLKTAASVKVGREPHEVIVSADGKRAYVANYGGRNPGNTLSIVDIEKKEAIGTIDLGKYRAPHGLALSPDGKNLYVTCEGAESLVRVRLPEEKVDGAVKTDQPVSHMVVVSPDGKKAYVTNLGGRSVTVIDNVEWKVIKQIPVENGPEGIDISPDGKEVWVGNRGSGTISIIDGKTDEVVGKIECPGRPIRVKFTPDGKKALVSCAGAGNVAVFDPSTRNELKRVATGTQPIGIVPSPDSRVAFVANGRDATVSMIDLESLKVMGLVGSVGQLPDGLAIVRSGTRTEY